MDTRAETTDHAVWPPAVAAEPAAISQTARKTHWLGLFLIACVLSVVRLAGLAALCLGPVLVRYGRLCDVARDILYPERFILWMIPVARLPIWAILLTVAGVVTVSTFIFTFLLGVTIPLLKKRAA